MLSCFGACDVHQKAEQHEKRQTGPGQRKIGPQYPDLAQAQDQQCRSESDQDDLPEKETKGHNIGDVQVHVTLEMQFWKESAGKTCQEQLVLIFSLPFRAVGLLGVADKILQGEV